mgnify:CR=1 FL=1
MIIRSSLDRNLIFTEKNLKAVFEWHLKEYEYFQADYNMYNLKKYMGYSNEKIAEIFEKDDLEKCLEEAAESYRALEHPEKTMQDAMKETAELFPFI